MSTDVRDQVRGLATAFEEFVVDELAGWQAVADQEGIVLEE